MHTVVVKGESNSALVTTKAVLYSLYLVNLTSDLTTVLFIVEVTVM